MLCFVLFVSLFTFSYWFFCLLFCGVVLLFSSGWKIWNQFYHYKISRCDEILNYNRLRQMALIRFQWDLNSQTCQGISDYLFHCGVLLSLYGVLFLTKDVFIQYNLLKGCCEWILTQPRILVIDYSLTELTWHIRLWIGICHLSISRIVVHGKFLISPCFYFSVIFYEFLFSCRLTLVWATKNPF